jgi:hypothetical protein
MTTRWEFDQGKESGQWRWLCIHLETQHVRCSKASFDTLRECQSDAVENGYLATRGERPPVERRRTPQQYSIPPVVERRHYA